MTEARSVRSDLADPRHCAVAANMGAELESVQVDVSIHSDYCSTLQTLRHGVEVATDFELE